MIAELDTELQTLEKKKICKFSCQNVTALDLSWPRDFEETVRDFLNSFNNISSRRASFLARYEPVHISTKANEYFHSLESLFVRAIIQASSTNCFWKCNCLLCGSLKNVKKFSE